jgi:hypothetical protein
MRRHSRWAVAVLTAVLGLALAAPGNARSHRRAHENAQPATGATTAPPAPAPPAGTRAIEPAVPPQSALADFGKVAMSAAALGPQDVEAILGKSVRSSAGEDMGRLVDVVVDRSGHPRAAIIDFGGFLGVGSRKIAVDWAALTFTHDNAKGDLITVELTRDQLKAAPEFKEGSQVVVLGASGAEPNPDPKPQAQEK